MYVNASFITSGPLALSAASAPNYFRAFSRLAGEHCGIGCFLAFLFVAIMLAIEDSRGEEQSPADNFLQKQQKQQKTAVSRQDAPLEQRQDLLPAGLTPIPAKWRKAGHRRCRRVR